MPFTFTQSSLAELVNLKITNSYAPIKCSSDGQLVYILDNTGTTGGLTLLTDGGTAYGNGWGLDTLVGGSASGSTVKVLVVSDDGQSVIFGGFVDGVAYASLYRSTNRGASWAAMTGLPAANGNGYTSMCASTNLQNLVVAYQRDGDNFVKYSIDFGATWTESDAPGANFGTVQAMASSSNGKYVYLIDSGTDLTYSSDYGATFVTQITASSMGVSTFTNLTCNNNGSQVYLACGTNGVYKSLNFGTSWAQLTDVPIGASKEYNSVSCDVTGNFVITANKYNNQTYTSIDGGISFILEATTGSPTNANKDQYVVMGPEHTTAYTVINEIGSSVKTLFNGVYNLVCFKEDTKILCKVNETEQYVPVQNLRKGDLVKTLSSGFKPIKMIGWKQMNHIISSERISEQLYVCSKNQFPEATEDLVITGAHSILVEKLTSTQEEKINSFMKQVYITENRYRLPSFIDERTAIYEKEGLCNIYHFALENDNYYMNYGVYANGILVESSSQRYLKELSGMTLIE